MESSYSLCLCVAISLIIGNRGPLGNDEGRTLQKAKRKLQEKLRRLRRTENKQRSLALQLKEGDANPEKATAMASSSQLKCGACGMVGHMRTNRTCPLYTSLNAPPTPLTPIQEEEIEAPPGTWMVSPKVPAFDLSYYAAPPIKMEGTKLIIPKKAFQPPSGDLVLRIKKDNFTLPKPSRKRKHEDDDGDSPEAPRHSLFLLVLPFSFIITHNLSLELSRSRIRKGGAGAEVELGNIFEKIINHVKTLPVVRKY